MEAPLHCWQMGLQLLVCLPPKVVMLVMEIALAVQLPAEMLAVHLFLLVRYAGRWV